MNNLTKFLTLTLLLSSFKLSVELEYNKQQRYNPSTDFLAHEGGSAWSNVAAPSNSDNAQNSQRIKDYNNEFPSLGAKSSSVPVIGSTPSTTTQKSQSGKRDYVAPQRPNYKAQAVGNPTPVPAQTPLNSNQHESGNQNPSKVTQPTGKRNYVAPQFTTQKPTERPSGNVKDLINFYDQKTNDQGGPKKMPSYSSILQNNNQGPTVVNSGTTSITHPVTPSTPKATPKPAMKPLSFSSVVAGSTKPGLPTQRPSSQGPTNLTPRPVLPSSLVNNNKNNNNQGAASSPSDVELQTLSEELLRKDTNNAAKYISVNYQQKTTSQSPEDKAPLPLLSVAPEAWNLPTIQKLVPLLDNYERDTSINEYVTAQERNEENAFMDVLMNTAVIRHLMNFLKDKGYVSPDPRQQRDFLKQLWFNLYSRGKGKISSSGFEHVFVSELKNGDVQGLHSWIFFAREEAANRVNYLGYLKKQELNDKGAVLKLHFSQQGVDKPVNSLFIGTSPELEIALYTLCFVTRTDNDCRLKLAANDVNIVTHTFRYRSKNYIGSAYPQI